MTARWTPRVIPLEPGNEDGPALVVDVEVDWSDKGLSVHVWQRGRIGDALPDLLPLVACQLGQALQDASAWCGQERARREARKR